MPSFDEMEILAYVIHELALIGIVNNLAHDPTGCLVSYASFRQHKALRKNVLKGYSF